MPDVLGTDEAQASYTATDNVRAKEQKELEFNPKGVCLQTCTPAGQAKVKVIHSRLKVKVIHSRLKVKVIYTRLKVKVIQSFQTEGEGHSFKTVSRNYLILVSEDPFTI